LCGAPIFCQSFFKTLSSVTAQLSEKITTLAAAANLDRLVEDDDPVPGAVAGSADGASSSSGMAVDGITLPAKYSHLDVTYVTPNVIGTTCGGWRELV
jgi:hypothetical protein